MLETLKYTFKDQNKYLKILSQWCMDTALRKKKQQHVEQIGKD